MGSRRNNRQCENYVHYPHFGSDCAETLTDHSNGLKPKFLNESVAKEDALNLYYKNRKIAEDDYTVFHGYSPKVLTSNWFYPRSSYPKDYDAYDPPGGNNFRSSYDRWGSSEDRMISETQAAQESFWKEYKQPQPKLHSPMINVYTLRNLDFRNFNRMLTSQPVDSEENGKTRKRSKSPDVYSTTMQRDFINHYPTEPKMMDREELYKPETKYRNLLTEIAHPRRPGFNKFYDENLEYLNAKKETKVAPPPWALHNNSDSGLIKEELAKETIPIDEITEEHCAKCIQKI